MGTKTCNISETVQNRTNYYDGLIRSRIRAFDWIPTSMTLDNLEQPKRSIAEKLYGAQQKELNDDRPILSAAKCRPMVL